MTKVKITEIGDKDGYRSEGDRKALVGQIGYFEEEHNANGWVSGWFTFIQPLRYYGNPLCFHNVRVEPVEEDTVNLEVKFDRKTAKKLEKLAKRWNLTQEETLVRILTEITTNKSVTPRDLTPDELAAFE